MAHKATLEYVRCNLCGADLPVPKYEKHGFTIVECSICGLMYVNPRPAQSQLAAIYDESYWRNTANIRYNETYYSDYIGERDSIPRISEIT